MPVCILPAISQVNAAFAPVSGVQLVDVDEGFQQERERMLAMRRAQEEARMSPESREQTMREVEERKRLPNQEVPGSKLILYVISAEPLRHQRLLTACQKKGDL